MRPRLLVASHASLAAFLDVIALTPAFNISFTTALHVVHHDTASAFKGASRAKADPALSVCPGALHTFACLFPALHSIADLGPFCTQVGLCGGVYRVHEHARHGGVSRREWPGQAAHPAGSYNFSWSRLHGFAQLGVPKRGWDSVGRYHPIFRVGPSPLW
jgi:hypothetical protein